MNTRKLRGRIRECYATQEAFAKALNISPTTLSKKLMGKTEWCRQEIEEVCTLLDIPVEEIPAYFFNQ